MLNVFDDHFIRHITITGRGTCWGFLYFGHTLLHDTGRIHPCPAKERHSPLSETPFSYRGFFLNPSSSCQHYLIFNFDFTCRCLISSFVSSPDPSSDITTCSGNSVPVSTRRKISSSAFGLLYVLMISVIVDWSMDWFWYSKIDPPGGQTATENWPTR